MRRGLQFPYRTCALFVVAVVLRDVAPAEAQTTDGTVAGVVIFDNVNANGGLDLAGASPASQLDLAFPFDAGAADDFVLGPSPLCRWSVTEVRWSGVYWGESDTGPLDDFRIVLWPDIAGAPPAGLSARPNVEAALAVYDFVGTAGEIPNPNGASGAHDYMATLPQPFEAVPETRYWIQIQARMPYPPQWGMHITHTRQGLGPVEYFDLLGLPAWTTVPDTGDLAFTLVGQPVSIDCDDADACTNDGCAGGECAHTPVVCDDRNACTEQACDPLQGCRFSPVACDDANACTTDTCDPTTGCQSTPVTCDDDNACTADSCDPAAGCTYTPIQCEDGNACTADRCDVVIGCLFTPTTCDDGNACTTDACNATTGCASTPITCDDENACTADSCDPAAGCAHMPIPCDDGNACTADRCDVGVGCITEPVTCDDVDACTIDACDPLTGCTVVPIVCDDGDACTKDSCVDGICVPTFNADLDGDGDVDLADFDAFAACLAIALDSIDMDQCQCSDLTHDGKVDLSDFAVFQTAFTAAREP